MLSPRHSGSRGTDTSSHRSATRAISATVASGSGTCSSTSIAAATSNSESEKERRVASSARYSRLGRRRVDHSCAQLRVLQVDAHDPGVVEPLGPLVREHAFAAAHVEHRPRLRRLPQIVQRAVEAVHQAAHHRVGRSVLVERVAGRDGLDLRGHASTASRDSAPLSPRPRRAGAPLRGPSHSGRGPRRASAPPGARARAPAAARPGCPPGCRRPRPVRRAGPPPRAASSRG